jgi:hypothetical protein
VNYILLQVGEWCSFSVVQIVVFRAFVLNLDELPMPQNGAKFSSQFEADLRHFFCVVIAVRFDFQ